MKKLKHKKVSSYDFGERGVQVSKSQIKKWKKEMIKDFENDISLDYIFKASGNSLVVGVRIKGFDIPIGEREILIWVADNGYKEYRYYPKKYAQKYLDGVI
jgi:hypothetical protein